MAMIQLTDVSFAYEGSYEDVFTHLTCRLDSVWRLGLIGRNGRGKTTLLRLLAGQLQPRGTIQIPLQPALFPFANPGDAMPTLQALHTFAPDAEEWRLQLECNQLGITETALLRPYATLSRGEQTKAQLAALQARLDGMSKG